MSKVGGIIASCALFVLVSSQVVVAQQRQKPSAPAPAPTVPAWQALMTEDIKLAQQLLKDRGINPGPIDGIVGPDTQRALREFQGGYGLPITGELDTATQTALGITVRDSPAKAVAAPVERQKPGIAPIVGRHVEPIWMKPTETELRPR